MKLKITMLITALIMISDILSAGPVIIISGGGRRQKFNYVYKDDGKIVCRGSGWITCPVGWYQAQEGPVTENVWDIVEYVGKLVDQGEKSGDIKYKDAIPVHWEKTGEDELTVKIDSEFKEIDHDER